MDQTQCQMLVNIMKNTVREATMFKHNKTGNMYIMLNDQLIECTNGREEKKYCLYANTEGKIFVREHDEFYNKFTKL